MSGVASRTVKARKGHLCDAFADSSWFRACSGRIGAGEHYCRVTSFERSTPEVVRICSVCAEGYFPDDVRDLILFGGAR